MPRTSTKTKLNNFLSLEDARTFSRLSAEKKIEFVSSLTDAEAAQLRYLWEAWARDNQLPPKGKWTVWLNMGGRGSGKTRTGAEWTRKKKDSTPLLHLIGRTAADVRDVMVEGESGILAISPPWDRPEYQPSKRRLVWNNGARATTFSADEPESLRGPQCLVGSTNVLMADGSQKKIAEIHVGDYVMTRNGSRRVTGHYMTKRNAVVYLLRSVDGRGIIGTAEHPVWVEGRGFIPMSLLSKGMSLCVTPVSSLAGIPGINELTGTTTNGESYSIESSGNKLMGLFQKGAIFTTRMVISLITVLKTLNCSLMASIVHCTTKGYSLTENWQSLTLKSLWSAIGKYDLSASLSAPSVGRNTIAVLPIQRASALLNALRQFDQELMQARCASVSIARKNTEQRNESSGIALESAITVQAKRELRHSSSERSYVTSAVPHSNQSVQTHASAPVNVPLLSTDIIASVGKLATPHDVYDITVEDAHELFADGILVHNCGGMWCDEPGAWEYAETAWDNASLGLRLGNNPQACLTTTPRVTKLIKRLVTSTHTKISRSTVYENRPNLAEAFFTEIIKRYEGTRLGRQELEGQLIEDNENALWRRDEMIEQYRVTKAPDLVRIGVALDPAVTSGEDSDETGIIVGGVSADGHGYILSDLSGRYTPIGWANQAVSIYHTLKADRMIAEGNQGGELLETTVRTVDKHIAFKRVHAKRGKYTRAEPVAALYEKGIVHHVGTFPLLEDELCQWEQGDAESPNRLDALVWLLTELMLGGEMSTQEHIEAMKRRVLLQQQRAAMGGARG